LSNNSAYSVSSFSQSLNSLSLNSQANSVAKPELSNEKVNDNLSQNTSQNTTSEKNLQKYSSGNSTNNQQKNSNSTISNSKIQIEPLVADNEHDVVVLEVCDLAVKFNKKYSISKKAYPYVFGSKDALVFESKNSPNDQDLTVNCSDSNIDDYQNIILKDILPENLPYFNKNSVSNISRIYHHTGDEDLNLATGIIDAGKDLNDPSNRSVYNGFLIKSKNNKTINLVYSRALNQSYDIEFQFNSLAPSTPSVKL